MADNEMKGTVKLPLLDLSVDRYAEFRSWREKW